MMFLGPGPATAVFCASAVLTACPAASDAEVNATPEINSLRFMMPHFHSSQRTQKDITCIEELQYC
jgi:Spy/CpxP family protein refolding chaperone